MLNFVLAGVAFAGFSDSRDVTKTSQGKKSVTLGDLGTLLERFSLDCRQTKTKVNTLANQRA